MKPFVKPFKAFFYNPQKFKQLRTLICPPYDVIKGAQKKDYQKSSPYNFSNILLVNNRKDYKALSKRFSRWMQAGVFSQDERCGFYLYEQEFRYGKKTFKRVGFLGLLKLDREGVVFPHENTLSAPKKDRLAVLKEVKANLSPIFVVSARKLLLLKKIYRRHCRKKPFIQFKDTGGCRHRLWKIADEDEMKALSEDTARHKLFIADGHHRFKVGSRYHQMYGKKHPDSNYILAYFTHPDTGLLVLPTHRVVEMKESIDDAFAELSRDFSIEKVTESAARRKLLRSSKREKMFSFGIYSRGRFYFLKLKNRRILGTISSQNRVYKSLDVWLLHHLVLRRFSLKNIEYAHRIDEVKELSGAGKTGFLVNTTPLETVFSIARKGKLLPQKSTYFYPKLPSGIVLRRFDA